VAGSGTAVTGVRITFKGVMQVLAFKKVAEAGEAVGERFLRPDFSANDRF